MERDLSLGSTTGKKS